MKKLMVALVLSVVAFGSRAANITIKNFDEDLATVYVNDVATTNGQVVAVDGDVKLELKDFRSDYYFRFAPASQADRTLGFDGWEGIPDGVSTCDNPIYFTLDDNITITPNVDVKGYAWQVVTNDGGTPIEIANHLHRFNWGSVDAATRAAKPGICITNLAGSARNDQVLDFIERVRYNGKNYTITQFGTGWGTINLKKSRIGTWALSPRYCSFGCNEAYGGEYCITNMVGVYDIKTISVLDAGFNGGGASFSGPATNFVARNTTSFGYSSYQGQQFTGELLLEKITSTSGQVFMNCSRLSAVRFASPNLSSLSASDFAGCTSLKDVIFAVRPNNLSSVPTTTFNASIITNFTFLVDPLPVAVLDNLLAAAPNVDGDHACRFTADAARTGWWNNVSDPTATEAAVQPANCMGVYVTGAGERKAWVVSSTPVGAVLLEGDMTMSGNAGFVPHAGLAAGDEVQMTAPAGYDQCQLQHRVDGAWTTYETVKSTSFTYTHGTELTRAVWGVDGYAFTTNVNCYGGAITVEVVSGQELQPGIYSKGAVLRLTGTGRTTHPTSHFSRWTSGIPASDAASAVVEITLTNDTAVAADFYPDEWIYNASTKKMTDGEWTCNAWLNGTEITVGAASGGQNGNLWLDVSLPVHPSTNLGTTYPVVIMNSYSSSYRYIRFGSEFRSFNGDTFFRDSAILARLDGLGGSKLTGFPYAFTYNCGNCPLRSAIYEANDFLPPGLRGIGWSAYMTGAPNLTGTLELNAIVSLYKTGSYNFSVFRDRLYGTSGGQTFCVSNILLTSKVLTEIPAGVFDRARIEKLTIGATNLTTVASSAFVNYDGRFREITFAANTPAIAALDGLVSSWTAVDGAHDGCLKVDPGEASWWDIVSVPSANELAAGLPADCLGTYVTAAGGRKAWIVGSKPLSGVLLEGDMLIESGTAGFVPRTGLAAGDEVQMTAPDGYDHCKLQHRVNGEWVTYETVAATSFTYTHGTELTRAVWYVAGYMLYTAVNNYGGTITPTLVSGKMLTGGIYQEGSVVRLTATGRATHPTSRFSAWTSGIAASDATNAVVEITMTNDVDVAADFYPEEWIYTSASNISDGEWTVTSSSLANGEITIGAASGGQGGTLWLDFSLPVHPAADLGTTYTFAVLNCDPAGVRRMRVGPAFKEIKKSPFMQYSTILERFDGLGSSQVKYFGYAYFYNSNMPLKNEIYEANDFIPPGLETVTWSATLAGVPKFTGTLELNAVTKLYVVGSYNWNFLNSRLYGTVNGRIYCVSNILLTCEGLADIPSGIFGSARVEKLTIGSTNLTTVASGAFGNYDGRFRSLTFLAHAPTVSALDNIVNTAATTNMTIYCSRHAPGWKNLRMDHYRAAPEWAGRPAGTWGIYQNAAGKKRFYMVQRDSKYDDRDGFLLLVR